MILVRLVETIPVHLIWLIHGSGPRYRRGPLVPPARATRSDPTGVEGPPLLVPPSGALAAARVDSALIGRRVRVPAWEDLRDVLDAPPMGIIREVYDLGRGTLVRVQGDGFDLVGDFTVDEIIMPP